MSRRFAVTKMLPKSAILASDQPGDRRVGKLITAQHHNLLGTCGKRDRRLVAAGSQVKQTARGYPLNSFEMAKSGTFA